MAENELTSVKNGEKAAFERLLERYEPLIRAEVSGVVSRNGELAAEADEMEQEGRLALYDAAMSYKENGGVTFGLYAKICVHNRLISYVRAAISRKKKEQNAALAKIPKSRIGAAEQLAYAYEGSPKLRRFIKENLTQLESKVLMLYMEKRSYKEMAELLGKAEKAVDNALARAKAKIKKSFFAE